MKKGIYEEILEKLQVPKNKWIPLENIQEIKLQSGRDILPNWKKIKFLFTEKELFIKYGNSESYGGKLPQGSFRPGTDYAIFPGRDEFKSDSGVFPKRGDMIRLYGFDGLIYGESMIDAINVFSNQSIIKFVTPIFSSPRPLFAFYDPVKKNAESIDGTIEPGSFYNFVANSGKWLLKKFGNLCRLKCSRTTK